MIPKNHPNPIRQIPIATFPMGIASAFFRHVSANLAQSPVSSSSSSWLDSHGARLALLRFFSRATVLFIFFCFFMDFTFFPSALSFKKPADPELLELLPVWGFFFFLLSPILAWTGQSSFMVVNATRFTRVFVMFRIAASDIDLKKPSPAAVIAAATSCFW